MAQNIFTFGESLSCSRVAWYFFAPNANIMPIDFAIRMKCGLITEHKTFVELVFFKFLLHINTELFSLSLVSCRYGLNNPQFVGFITKRFLTTRRTVVGGIMVSIIVLLIDFWGFARVVRESARPSLLLLLVVQILLLCIGSLHLRIYFSSSKSAQLLVTS